MKLWLQSSLIMFLLAGVLIYPAVEAETESRPNGGPKSLNVEATDSSEAGIAFFSNANEQNAGNRR